MLREAIHLWHSKIRLVVCPYSDQISSVIWSTMLESNHVKRLVDMFNNRCTCASRKNYGCNQNFDTHGAIPNKHEEITNIAEYLTSEKFGFVLFFAR